MNNNSKFYVYILANKNNKVLYIGVTNNLHRRLYEHKNKLIEGFTEKYNVNKLIYFEETENIKSAILREKEIKKWRREKKENLINTINSEWKDLSDDWM
ncbi:MAG TPA: GIY-YIG nuclease family protein [Spirochaetota bacterium]|mgnify:CR=1 FL=1|nr:GIY-YIG nuclease family protein [Spirochaetota bacterium]HPR38712.1 GIY-YIG nuclease family protein [Spirochaetota bacterium]